MTLIFAEAPSRRLGDGFVAIVGELAHLADIASVSRWRVTRAAGARGYPSGGLCCRLQGSVTLSMIVEPGGHGRQGSVRVLGASDLRFVQAARWVALRLPFRAATLGDHEVAAPTRLSVAFVLPDG